MALLIPTENETKEEFISRFMGDAEIIIEFPYADNRMAIAVSQWEAQGNEVGESLNTTILDEADSKLEATNKPQWILCFPFGQFYIEKYDTILEMSDDFYTDIVTAFNSDTLSKPFVDKDHEFAESFGEILEMKVIQDDIDLIDEFNRKGLYTLINFNKKGIEAIKNNEYNYISPAWGKVIDVNGTGFGNKLMAISLVNFPAFEGELPKLQEQLSFVAKKMNISEFKVYKLCKESNMDLTKITEIFELSKDASVDSIYSKVVELKKVNIDATEKVAELTESLTLSKESETKLMEENVKMGKTLSDIEVVKLQSEAKNFILIAVEKGQMHPTQVELMTDMYVSDKEKVIKLLSLVPEKDPSQSSQTGSDTGVKIELSDKERARLIELGLDVDDKEQMTAYQNAKGDV